MKVQKNREDAELKLRKSKRPGQFYIEALRKVLS